MATPWVNVEAIGSYFASLSDPRPTRNRKPLLGDSVGIAACSLVCGCDGPTAIRRWATNRLDGPAEFPPLPEGIPSRGCIRRLLLALQPEAFGRVSGSGSPTPCRPLTTARPGWSPSTARPAGGPTTRRTASARRTS